MVAKAAEQGEQIELEICTVKVEGNNATITTSLSGDQLMAIYPAKYAVVTQLDGKGGNKTVIRDSIPSVQTGKFADANICSAEIGKGNTAEFKNTTAVLRFYVDKSIGVQSIRITGSGIADDEETGNVITVEAPAGMTLDAVTDDPDKRICYVSVADEAGGNLNFEIRTTTQDTVKKNSNKFGKIAGGRLYTVFIPYYIDLGDAGKWAYCNIGAFLPEEPGYYFSWGNTQGYVYDGQNWVSAPGGQTVLSGGFTEENYAGTNGSSISGRSLKVDVTEDAACAAWGGKWRIPTKEEYETLKNTSGKSWENSYNSSGQGGMLIQNQLFFPGVGIVKWGGLDPDTSEMGHYWNSDFEENGLTGSALFANVGSLYFITASAGRFFGLPIRPIYASAPATGSTVDDFDVKDDDSSNWQ